MMIIIGNDGLHSMKISCCDIYFEGSILPGWYVHVDRGGGGLACYHAILLSCFGVQYNRKGHGFVGIEFACSVVWCGVECTYIASMHVMSCLIVTSIAVNVNEEGSGEGANEFIALVVKLSLSPSACLHCWINQPTNQQMIAATCM